MMQSILADARSRLATDADGPGSVVLAAAVLLLGLALAFVVRSLARRLVRRLGEHHAEHGRAERWITGLAFWSVVAVAVLAGSAVVGVPIVHGWIADVGAYLPRLLAAALVIAVGAVLARTGRSLTMRAARSANVPGVERVGRATEVAILATAALVAIEQVGIEVSFIKSVLLLLIAAALFASALAFGLGSREIVADVLASHYLKRNYQVGQTIRAEGVEGRIARITEIAVIVETPEGQLSIPCSQLARTRSTLVLRGGAR